MAGRARTMETLQNSLFLRRGDGSRAATTRREGQERRLARLLAAQTKDAAQVERLRTQAAKTATNAPAPRRAISGYTPAYALAMKEYDAPELSRAVRGETSEQKAAHVTEDQRALRAWLRGDGAVARPEARAAVERELAKLSGAPKTAGTRTKAASKAPEALPPLVPIGHVPGYHVDPFAPPDPHFLTQLYGHHQLAHALQDYTLDMLKDAAARIEQRHPGTKPANRGRKDAVIAYIVEHSAKE